jgi:mannosyl-3-phosphoglycerate phosphatase family protein
MKQLLIFTDLDGTLLDHDDYSFDAAAAALAQVRRAGYPLIMASSKTRREMELLRRQLAINYPFVCENGAAICTPVHGDIEIEALAPPRREVLAVLGRLREVEGYRFTGFADCSIAEIVQMTGLSTAQARLAATREFSEPILWQDSDRRLAEFRGALAGESMQAQQGGRFLSIAGYSDKALALHKLRERYGGVENTLLIALGDSPNDETMLAAADIAVIIRSAHSEALQPTGPSSIIRTEARGPSGWQEAMSELLARAQKQQPRTGAP